MWVVYQLGCCAKEHACPPYYFLPASSSSILRKAINTSIFEAAKYSDIRAIVTNHKVLGAFPLEFSPSE